MARRLDRGQLAQLLHEIAELIVADDSFEGMIRYSATEIPGEFTVDCAYRIGNAHGQGGWRMLGTPTGNEG